MESTTKFVDIFLIILLNLIFSTIRESHQKELLNLRQFKNEGFGGKFVVDRDALEEILQDRIQQDATCGKDVKLQLAQSLQNSTGNVSPQGEIMLIYFKIFDFTLTDELSTCLKDQVATDHQHLQASLPVLIGKEEEHGLLNLHVFTNSTKRMSVPYFTSSRNAIHVDSIEEGENGTVTLRLDDDVMTIQVQETVQNNDDIPVGKYFNQVNSEFITATNYLMPFDWDCGFLGFQISFCQVLDEVRCELAAFEGDVCTISLTSSSERFPVRMSILNMTGSFRDMFPYLPLNDPLESIEAEVSDRRHSTGIRYPCLTL